MRDEDIDSLKFENIFYLRSTFAKFWEFENWALFLSPHLQFLKWKFVDDIVRLL